MKIYLVRHGQTEWNLETRMQGALDSPLTPRGRKDAEKLEEEIKDLPLDKIYSSPQGRALETAKILKGNRPIPLVQKKDLRELSVGLWEGKIFEDMVKLHPKEVHRYLYEPHLYQPEGEESYYDVYERVEGFLEDLQKTKDQAVLVVSHGVTINALLNVMEGIPVKDFWKKPLVLGTELSIVEEKDGCYHVVKRADPVGDLNY